MTRVLYSAFLSLCLAPFTNVLV